MHLSNCMAMAHLQGIHKPSRPYPGLGGTWSSVIVLIQPESIHRDSYKWFRVLVSVSACVSYAKFVKDLRNWVFRLVPPWLIYSWPCLRLRWLQNSCDSCLPICRHKLINCSKTWRLKRWLMKLCASRNRHLPCQQLQIPVFSQALEARWITLQSVGLFVNWTPTLTW